MSGRGKSSILPAWMTGENNNESSSSNSHSHYQEESTRTNSNSWSSSDNSRDSRKQSEQRSETANILNALKETPSVQPGGNSSKSSIKRPSENSSRISRFDKKQENVSSFQPLMQISLSKNNISKSTTSSAADWRVCRTAEGVEYYYNQRTRAKTYDKPDVLKSEAELSLKPCAWKEYKTADGRTYWNNSSSGISVWEEPEEFTQYKAELSRLQETANVPAVASFFPADSALPQNTPFIPTVSAPAVEAAATFTPEPVVSPKPEPSPEVEAESAVIPTWSNAVEARAAFESLLKEVVVNPSTSWKEAVPQLMRDIRFTAIEKAGQRKQIFSEFVNRMVKERKEQKMKQAIQFREAFRALLKNSPLVTAESTIDQVESVLRGEEVWSQVDSSERTKEIRDHLQKLQAQAREAKKEAYKKQQAEFEALMEELQVGRQSKWNEFEAVIQERFSSPVIAGKAQRDLFYDYVDRVRSREEKATAALQAKLKQDVYDLFEEYLRAGKITASTKYEDIWQEVEQTAVVKEIQAKQVKLRAEFIFKDFMVRVEDRVHLEEQDMLYFLRKGALAWEKGDSLESFNERVRACLESPESAEGKSGLDKKAREYFTSWLAFVEKRAVVAGLVFDRVKKEMRRSCQSAEEKEFKRLLGEYLYEKEHLEYTYEDVEPQLKVHKRWTAVKKEEERKAWYKEYLEGLREKMERKKERQEEKARRRKHR